MKRFIKYAVPLAAVAGLLGLAGAGTASAAIRPAVSYGTPSCGSSCVNISNEEYGANQVLNGANTGKVTLRAASNAYPNEDIVLNGYYRVSHLVAVGVISAKSYVALNYPNHYAIELGFSPYGSGTTSCAGVASAAVAGEKVTKQACGVSARTFWVFDPKSGSGSNCLNDYVYCPVINASDTSLTTPEMLTATGPTSKLVTDPKRVFSSGDVEDQQQFEHSEGVTP